MNSPSSGALIPDDPSVVDEFSAGAHKKVAEAIAKLVTEEDGGRVIGLEGWWGSGKSTVVQLIEESFESADEGKKPKVSAVLVFDAWAHQGDPLRRTFLEKLIEEFVSIEWLLPDRADVFRNQLSGRSSEVNTESTSHLTPEARWAAFAALLIPIGAALFANKFAHYHRALLAVGVVLLLAPVLVITSLVLLKFIGKALGGDESSKRWRDSWAQLEPTRFLAKQQVEEVTRNEVIHGEPTSVEFEGVFKDVLGDALVDDRRLLIVLDNLDRVEKSDAKTVIATMQTFTDLHSDKSLDWRNSVWTLIPYDPEGLDRLWEDNSLNGNTGSARVSVTGRASRTSDSTSAAFLEKLFQVRFESPPLVLSDRRGFVKKLVARALPTTSEDERDGIARIRELYPGAEPEGLVAKEPTTPRQIKQFVNQIASVRRLRADIPLVHIAYYVLLKRDRIHVEERLKNGLIPHAQLVPFVSDDAGRDLAALHFGTDPEHAQQLLLSPSIDSALAKGDADELFDLAGRNGFEDALEDVNFQIRTADGAVEFSRAVSTLETASVLPALLKSSWFHGVLRPLALSQDEWILSGEESGIGVAILADEISKTDPDAFEHILERAEISALEADPKGTAQLAGYAELLNTLLLRGRASEALRVSIGVSQGRVVETLARLNNLVDDDVWSAIDVSRSATSVALAIGDALETNNVGIANSAVAVLKERPDQIDFVELRSACAVWMRNQDPVELDQIKFALDILDGWASSEDPRGKIFQGLADDGTFMHHVQFALQEGWVVEAARLSMLHLWARPNFPEPDAQRLSSQGVQFVRNMLADPQTNTEFAEAQLDWLTRHANAAFEVIAQIDASGSAHSWVDFQARRLEEESSLEVTAEQFLDQASVLKRALPNEAFRRLLGGVLKTRAARKTIQEGSSDAAIAELALDSTREDASSAAGRDVTDWASGIVGQASEADWIAEMTNPGGGPLLELALALSTRLSESSNPAGLDNAINEHFHLLASGQLAWGPTGEEMLSLSKLLAPSARDTRASQFCAWLEGRDGEVAPSVFSVYGEWLIEEESFRTHAKLPGFVERLVARDDWENLEWIVKLVDHQPNALAGRRTSSAVTHLKHKVEEKLSTLPVEARPAALLALAGALKVKVPKN